MVRAGTSKLTVMLDDQIRQGRLGGDIHALGYLPNKGAFCSKIGGEGQ